MFIILHLHPFLLLLVLLINTLNQCHEVLLDIILLLAHLDLEALQFLLDRGAVLPDELDLVIDLGQLVQDLVFVLLVHLAEVDDLMRAVLGIRNVYFAEHAAIGTDGVLAVLAVVGHLNAMICALFFHFLTALHGG